MSWFSKFIPKIKISNAVKKTSIPEGLWYKCLECTAYLFKNELEKNLYVCPKCNYHMRITARQRIEFFLDKHPQEEIAINLKPIDLLKFRDTKKYKDRLIEAQKKTKENDALIVVKGRLKGLSLVVCAFEFNFIAGSMGAVVGEKFVQAANVSLKESIPLVCFSCSGGARMQESLISLMQMAKTSAVLKKLSDQKIPYISLLKYLLVRELDAVKDTRRWGHSPFQGCPKTDLIRAILYSVEFQIESCRDRLCNDHTIELIKTGQGT